MTHPSPPMTRQHHLLVSVGLTVWRLRAHLIERRDVANGHRMKHGVVCFSDAGVYWDRIRGGGADSGCCPHLILETSQQKQKQQTILWYDAKKMQNISLERPLLIQSGYKSIHRFFLSPLILHLELRQPPHRKALGRNRTHGPPLRGHSADHCNTLLPKT